MWMQILVAADLPVVGRAFPKNWKGGALRDANRDGFFEGRYRDGIFFATNPGPDGRYVRPQDTKGKIAKVFIPGVLRTEYAHIQGVIANVREWREYTASVDRLWALDEQQRLAEEPDMPPTLRLPAPLEWWAENFALIRDQQLRGYPAVIQTYDQVLADPAKYVREALEMIGRGDLKSALTAVKPDRRTQAGTRCDAVEPHIAQAFDDLHAAVAAGKGFSKSLISKLIAVNTELEPQVLAARMKRATQILCRSGRPHPAFVMAASMG